MTKSIGPELPEDPQHKPVEKPTGKFSGMREVSQTPDLPSKRKVEDVAQVSSQQATELKTASQFAQGGKKLKPVLGESHRSETLFSSDAKPPEQELSSAFLQSLGMGQLESETIVDWITQNNKELLTIQKRDMSFKHLITTPKGLKYYRTDDGSVHIQFKRKVLATGSFKKVSSIYDISLLNFSVLRLVRFSAKEVKDRQGFIQDIDKELSIRQQLKNKGPLPEEIADIRAITYMAKNGELKTRYIGEECEGTVFDLIYLDRRGETFNRQLDKNKVYQLLLNGLYGLKFLHDNDFIHRDIKPENFLRKNDRGKLTDLGFAMKFDPDGKIPTAASGTQGYVAPEIFTGLPKAVKASDMFSFGLMLLEMCDNNTWRRVLGFQSLMDIVSFNYFIRDYRKFTEQNYSENQLVREQQKLIYDLLNPNPDERPDIDQTIERLKAIIALLN